MSGRRTSLLFAILIIIYRFTTAKILYPIIRYYTLLCKAPSKFLTVNSFQRSRNFLLSIFLDVKSHFRFNRLQIRCFKIVCLSPVMISAYPVSFVILSLNFVFCVTSKVRLMSDLTRVSQLGTLPKVHTTFLSK